LSFNIGDPVVIKSNSLDLYKDVSIGSVEPIVGLSGKILDNKVFEGHWPGKFYSVEINYGDSVSGWIVAEEDLDHPISRWKMEF
jgi:hypothetical protein